MVQSSASFEVANVFKMNPAHAPDGLRLSIIGGAGLHGFIDAQGAMILLRSLEITAFGA